MICHFFSKCQETQEARCVPSGVQLMDHVSPQLSFLQSISVAAVQRPSLGKHVILHVWCPEQLKLVWTLICFHVKEVLSHVREGAVACRSLLLQAVQLTCLVGNMTGPGHTTSLLSAPLCKKILFEGWAMKENRIMTVYWSRWVKLLTLGHEGQALRALRARN